MVFFAVQLFVSLLGPISLFAFVFSLSVIVSPQMFVELGSPIIFKS